jgi:peptidoglycan/LPS O-acetylase OafA/YrhL
MKLLSGDVMHTNGRAAELDLLRFAAALAVVFFHYHLDVASESTGLHLAIARYG